MMEVIQGSNFSESLAFMNLSSEMHGMPSPSMSWILNNKKIIIHRE